MLDGGKSSNQIDWRNNENNFIIRWVFFGSTPHKYPVTIDTESQGYRDDTNLLKCSVFFFIVEIQSALLVYSQFTHRTT